MNSHCFKLHQSYSISSGSRLICKMLAKFSGVESERTVLKFRERQRNFLCCVYLNPIKQESEIRKFHVAVVKRRLRIVQKSVMHVQSWCFAYINLLLFNCSPSLSSLLLWSRNSATMVTWRRTSVTRRPFCLRRFKKLCLCTASLVLTKLSIVLLHKTRLGHAISRQKNT